MLQDKKGVSVKKNDFQGKFDKKNNLAEENSQLKKQIAACKEQTARALADYQNLVRRQKEDQTQLIKAAQVLVFSSLLQPLTHLSLAAENLQDQGLNLVVEQFWQTLKDQGLQKMELEGGKFDPEKMEAVEKTGENEVVTEVITPGYLLHGQVLQVAKVKVG